MNNFDNRMVARFASTLMERTEDGVLLISPSGVITLANPAAGKIIGCDEERLKGLSIFHLMPGSLPRFSMVRAVAEVRRYGEWVGEIKAQWPGKSEMIHCISRISCYRMEIDDAKNAEDHWTLLHLQDRRDIEEASKLAVTDPLTGLPNRRLFEDRLQSSVAHANRYGGTLGVFFLDLDLFKRINDTIGHHAGDAVLKEIGKRLSATVRESDSVARMGGDEFTIIATEIGSAEQAMRLAKRLISVVTESIEFEDHELVISTSVGLALYPEHGRSSEELLNNADLAMYEAKSSGRNDLCVYNEGLRNRTVKELDLEQRLRRAIDEKELDLAFQPVANLETGEWISVEALLRWKDPELQKTDTGWLITLAERFGMIKRLGMTIIDRAVETWSRWDRPIPMSLNLSPDQVDEALVEHLRTAVRRHKIPDGMLCIEIHEAGLFSEDGQQLLAAIRDINAIGIRLAVDDFGSAQSSLRALRDLPVDMIKLDGHFIKDIKKNNPGRQIVKAVLAMAEALNVEVIAEGVETKSQISELVSLGCSYGQGYALARPMPEDEVALRWSGAKLGVDD